MIRQIQFSSILRCGVRLCVGCLLANGVAARAQEPPPGSPHHHIFRSGVHFGLVINGSDIGTILLKASDADRDGKATLAEIKTVASACFKLWDTNTDSSVSENELSTALRELLPPPPPGAIRGRRVINGVGVEVPPHELPAPDAMLARHIVAGTDSNKDGLIATQELEAFLDNNFLPWDQDGNGSLVAQELAAAFGQLVLPHAHEGTFQIAVPPPAR